MLPLCRESYDPKHLMVTTPKQEVAISAGEWKMAVLCLCAPSLAPIVQAMAATLQQTPAASVEVICVGLVQIRSPTPPLPAVCNDNRTWTLRYFAGSKSVTKHTPSTNLTSNSKEKSRKRLPFDQPHSCLELGQFWADYTPQCWPPSSC